MPTLFISYKRGTEGIDPLRERLAVAKYRIWYDKDNIHSGDDWQDAINQGIDHSDAVIVGLTLDACESKFVQHEVRRALDKNKPIFPVKMQAFQDSVLAKLGMEKMHYLDFTSPDPDDFNRAMEQLLGDLGLKGLRVTRHDRRQQRDNTDPVYLLHQRYLTHLTERIGTLNLAQIDPEGRSIELERVYVNSPIGLYLSVEVQDWRVVDWWIDEGRQSEVIPRRHAADWGFDESPLLALVAQIDTNIERYRLEHPDLKLYRGLWNNGEHWDETRLDIGDIVAVRHRLVILGGPGSGKSTFVRHLALCLAGAQIDGWTRPATLDQLGSWAHGVLTPIYVELRRFVTSAQYPVDYKVNPSADDLWKYIEADLLGSGLSGYAVDLKLDLEQGHAVLILDGLDEVPYDEGKLPDRQRQLRELAASLNRAHPHSRIVVTSRPYAYEGWQLPNFDSILLSAYEDSQREALANRLYQVAGLAPDDAVAKTKAFNQQLKPIDPELKDRPLFVTLMATIFLRSSEGGLPTRRGELYRRSILLLLDRWTKTKPDVRSLLDILDGATVDEVLARLAALAYEVHERYGEKPGTPEIGEDLLFRHFKPLGRHIAVDLITYLSENAAVLVCPGQNTMRDIFHFAHRTFQEYLAACEIVRRCQEADSFIHLRDLIQTKPQVWREPGRLVADVLVEDAHASDLWQLIGDLLGDELLADMAANAAHWWSLWLASAIADEQGLTSTIPARRVERLTRDFLRDYVVLLVETPQALPPIERSLCGRILSALDDNRRGVGLDTNSLPNIVWCEVPAGEFIYQDEKKLNLLTFSVSKYPITYKQFQAFIDAPDGYRNSHWWQGLHADGLNQHQGGPDDQWFKFWNHPRERISWYDAIAFCRWLSAKLGYEITLPTEEQWEKAARGTDGRTYSYDNDFDLTKGNTYETGIGRTSVVGIFPDPALPYGILDMSGNVWEWTLTEYESGNSKKLTNNRSRVVRGGSWGDNLGFSRATFRSYTSPISRNNDLGFRVCCMTIPR